MAERRVILRTANERDAADMAEVERQSWPSELAASESLCLARVNAYPHGQWVAESDGRIVGVSSAQRITAAFLDDNRGNYDQVTDGGRFANSHNDDGEIYQLIGVGVLPKYRGENLGRKLVDRQIEWARSLPGICRIVGFTRPAGYHKFQRMSIDEYVRAHDENGALVDPVLAFHLDAGARIVSIHPNFRPEDLEAVGFGILIEYPLK